MLASNTKKFGFFCTALPIVSKLKTILDQKLPKGPNSHPTFMTQLGNSNSYLLQFHLSHNNFEKHGKTTSFLARKNTPGNEQYCVFNFNTHLISESTYSILVKQYPFVSTFNEPLLLNIVLNTKELYNNAFQNLVDFYNQTYPIKLAEDYAKKYLVMNRYLYDKYMRDYELNLIDFNDRPYQEILDQYFSSET